ncbi:hypothetical protein HPP92_016304 [Vanilla planifolia]|uniref:1-phosphatidylinositol-4-phosphate 5-kinase n=1 Tax=Vanilla planifolia TaxID=51239 RepID=A0A835QHA7_VANPL|nr:hypothetical protein HPP92_016304 [Vanilla planifolia]
MGSARTGSCCCIVISISFVWLLNQDLGGVDAGWGHRKGDENAATWDKRRGYGGRGGEGGGCAKGQISRRRVRRGKESDANNGDGCVRRRDVEVEKALPNGDIYCGEFAGNAPHGRGSTCGPTGVCTRGGRRGRPPEGKFSWPSGATYEGEFKSGRMDGFGTFIGADGETYRGSWNADRKHGYGSKSYANGDFFEGQWRKNLQEGQGRYVWRNGNQYVGEWRSGVICGRGVLIWVNGNRFDGYWESGIPKGSGVFTWPDGSCYVGTWSNDLRSQQHLNGTFYPAVVAGRRSCSTLFGGSLPSSKKRPSDGIPGRRTFPGSAYGIPTVKPATLPATFLTQSKPQCFTRMENPLGCFGPRELKPCHFDPKEQFWTRFPPEGSKTTPPHHSTEFRWKDYCPMVFRHLRTLFMVDTADYMLAICGNEALRELSSPGKSGSSFYLTQDDRFMIKTVKKSEVKVLIKMLSSYFKHVSKYRTH